MKRNKKQYFLPVILAALVIVALVLYVSSKPKKQILYNQLPGVTLTDGTPLPTSPSMLGDSKFVDKDGLFIDYQNGFKFEYPQGLLKSEPAKDYGYGLSKQFSIYDGNGNKSHWLGYGVTNNPTSDDLFYKIKPLTIKEPFYKVNDYEKNPKDKWPLWNYTKISDLSVNNLDGIEWYTFPTGGGEGEMSWGYTAAFQIDGKLVTIYVYTNIGKSQLDTQKETFDRMVSSLRRVASK
ncbi:hypothetical protein KBA63_04080 [Candidatus Woesebacteria bacterium]|jgi:hypothetical protein|nr:hypothetical protein [Candidatus Woesebacteria bacterium]MBP9820199.1 hypothetical protein [Candidatus Woesebacteria bacterium]